MPGGAVTSANDAATDHGGQMKSARSRIARNHDQELIASESRNTAGRNGSGELIRDVTQNVVPDVVAVLVVDLLEPVDVDHCDARRPRVVQSQRQILVPAGAIPRTGQRIVRGLVSRGLKISA